MLLLLPAVAAFQPAPLRMLPRAARSGFLPVGKAGTDGQPADDVKITIRKPEARTAAPESVFVAQFAHVKPSVATFLKFWLMGGSADGWAGTGELEAQHSPSGTKASILVDVEQATVTLVSPSAASAAICAGAVSASLSPSGASKMPPPPRLGRLDSPSPRSTGLLTSSCARVEHTSVLITVGSRLTHFKPRRATHLCRCRSRTSE